MSFLTIKTGKAEVDGRKFEIIVMLDMLGNVSRRVKDIETGASTLLLGDTLTFLEKYRQIKIEKRNSRIYPRNEAWYLNKEITIHLETVIELQKKADKIQLEIIEEYNSSLMKKVSV